MIRLIRKVKNDSKNSIKINSKFVRFDSTPPLSIRPKYVVHLQPNLNCIMIMNLIFKVCTHIKSIIRKMVLKNVASDLKFHKKQSKCRD